MTIEVVTAATDYDLTTVDAVKITLNLPDGLQDPFIATLITRASQAISQYCRRVFAKEEVTETIPGTDTARMFLERVPLISVTSVTYDGDAVDAADYAIERHERGTLLMEDKWTLSTYGDDIGKPDWAIRYYAGWVLPNHSGTRDLPHDVEQACIETVKTWYHARCRDQSLRTEEIVDAWQGTYSGHALPMIAKELLNPWRVLRA